MRRKRPLDDPRFGKAEHCVCVLAESVADRRSRLERLSNLGPLTRHTFASFRGEGRDARALEVAQAFAREPQGWLTILGPSGTGKTHLAAAIANARIAAGEQALFMVVADMLDHLRSGYDADAEDLSFDQLFEHVRNAPLLLLDDIDGSAGTPWAKEKLFQILNHRFNSQLPTVFTASGAAKTLDLRIESRLRDANFGQVVELGQAGAAVYRQVGGMLRERLDEFTFREFDVRGIGIRPEERESLRSALASAQAFAANPAATLTITGPSGSGKTHLAAAIASRVARDGRSVFFAVVADLLDAFRAGFRPGADGESDALFDAARETDLLVLDDLGRQQSSSWAHEKLFQILNSRTLRGLPTVVTTELSLDELAKVNPKLLGRLADPRLGTVILVNAPHYRLRR
ncbi:MAG: ATP-binding protein [Dehalococcoidia bacterium]